MSVEKIIETIRDYADRFNETVVNFSGGKYSLVLLHLASKSLRDNKAVYVETTIGLPECCEYIKDVCDEWGVDLVIIKREDTDFWNLVRRRGFPTPRFTWCRRELKFIPLKLFSKSINGDVLHLTGTTINESNARRRIYSIRGKYYFNYTIGSYIFQPIMTWNEKMVNEYIEKHRLPINPCYDIYNRSGDCYYCPHHTKREYYIKLSRLQPKLFQKIVKAETSLRSKGAALYLGKGKLLYISKLPSSSKALNEVTS